MEDSVLVSSNGDTVYWGKMTFQGSIFGSAGTIEMVSFGTLVAGETEWTGNWMRVNGSGTGDLSTVSGKGTWWGPGWLGDPTTYGQIGYAGEVNFGV